jgi:plastocyanin
MRRPATHLLALILCGLLVLGVTSAIGKPATTGVKQGTKQRCDRHGRAWRRRHPHARCKRPGKSMLDHAGPTSKVPVTTTSPLPAEPGVPATSTPAPVGAPGTGGEALEGIQTGPPSVPHVQVTAVEYSFTLSRETVPAGKVIFEFVNNGQDEHNLNVMSSGGEMASTFADTPSKGVHDQAVEMHAGTYVMFCSLPEHEKKGMKATLVVQ